MSDVVIVDPGGAPGFVEVPQPVDPTIVTIAKGDTGPPGADGKDGADGVGVPAGGMAGEVLTKTGASDHATGWTDLDALYPRLWRGTQAAYDALGVYDPMTLYVVEG